jgi:hypothetical protein
VAREHRGDLVAQLSEAERLRDEVLRAELRGAVMDVVRGGRDDRRHLERPCAQLLHQLAAAHAGHHEVEHHERDVVAACDEVERLTAVRRRHDVVLRTERQLEGLEDVGVVIYDQNSPHRSRRQN